MKKLLLAGVVLSLAACSSGGHRTTDLTDYNRKQQERFKKQVSAQKKRGAAIARWQRNRAAQRPRPIRRP